MQERYDNGLTKVDLTEKGLVKGWTEKDNKNNNMYIFYVASPGTTHLPSSLNYMFMDFVNLQKVVFDNINTSKVTKMSNLFSGCNNLSSIDLSKFNTSKVTDMSGLFSGCHKLSSIDLSKFNTSNVTDMSSLFAGCNNLKELNLSNFDTSNVTNMRMMFNSCTHLEKLDISNFLFSSSLKANKENYELIFEYTGTMLITGLTNVTVRSELERSWILNLSENDRTRVWNNSNIILK